MKTKLIVLALGFIFSTMAACSSKTKTETAAETPAPVESTQDTSSYSVASSEQPVNLGASSSGFSH